MIESKLLFLAMIAGACIAVGVIILGWLLKEAKASIDDETLKRQHKRLERLQIEEQKRLQAKMPLIERWGERL